MLEYFTYKKVKKHQQEKQGKEPEKKHGKKHHEPDHNDAPAPVLTPNDEEFLQRITSEDGPGPDARGAPVILEAGNPTGNEQQLVVRGDDDLDDDAPRSRGLDLDEPASSSRHIKGKGKAIDTAQKKTNRLSFLQRTFTKKNKEVSRKPHVNSDGTVTPNEAAKEKEDITSLLDNLNLSAVNNRAFSLSKESQVLVQKFTVILKDLVNGVPTAYDDLVGLLDESSGVLQENYKHLPSYLQKLIKTLPGKVSGALGPELMATAAAAAGGAEHGGKSHHGGKTGLSIPSLKDLVTKPGAVIGILKAIMNFLKLRWPAFLGTNVLWSLGLFVLLFVFWYCHKRGRETRLAQERLDRDGNPIPDGERFEELTSEDDFDEYEAEYEDPRRAVRHGGASSSSAPEPRGHSERRGHRHREDYSEDYDEPRRSGHHGGASSSPAPPSRGHEERRRHEDRPRHEHRHRHRDD